MYEDQTASGPWRQDWKETIKTKTQVVINQNDPLTFCVPHLSKNTFCPFIYLPLPSHAPTQWNLLLRYPAVFSIPHASLIPHNYLPNPFPTPLLLSSSLPSLSLSLSPFIYPPSSRSHGSLPPPPHLLHLFSLIPSQRPPDNGVSVIPPYVISSIILSISHD